jgi:pimeloyl-ACP methyl ester carboxylesterase
MEPVHNLSDIALVYKGQLYYEAADSGHPVLFHHAGVALPLSPPAADRQAKISVPTLILIGEYDTTSTLAKANKLEKDIPGACKIIYPASAHMLPMEQPKRFNEVDTNFLKKELINVDLPSPYP